MYNKLFFVEKSFVFEFFFNYLPAAFATDDVDARVSLVTGDCKRFGDGIWFVRFDRLFLDDVDKRK